MLEREHELSTTTTTERGILALIIDPDGPARVEQVPAGWPALREVLGGWIIRIGGRRDGEPWVALLDEDGGPKGLPRNRLATALALALGSPVRQPGGLVGRVIFLGLGRNGKTETDVPEPVLRHARVIGVLAAAGPPTREDISE